MSTKKNTNAANEQPQVIVSCEDPHTTYLCYRRAQKAGEEDRVPCGQHSCRPSQQNAEGWSEAPGNR